MRRMLERNCDAPQEQAVLELPGVALMKIARIHQRTGTGRRKTSLRKETIPGERRAGMDILTRYIVTTACGILLMNGLADAARQKGLPESYPMPEAKRDCTTCHLAAGPNQAGELRKGLSSLCLDCHPDRKAPAEHKVDIAPSREVKGLPLTKGNMTCFTCHDPHRNLHGKLLRMNPRDLCLVCHPL